MPDTHENGPLAREHRIPELRERGLRTIEQGDRDHGQEGENGKYGKSAPPRHLIRNRRENRLLRRDRRGSQGQRRNIDFRNVRSGGQAKPNFIGLDRCEIILRQTLAHFARRATHNGILIRVVKGVAFKNIDADRAFLQPIQLLIERTLDDVPQETRTLSAGVELCARKHPLQIV